MDRRLYSHPKEVVLQIFVAWLVHQSSLVVLPAETSVASGRNGGRSENFAYQCLKYLSGFLTCHKILRHGTSDFTSHPEKGVLRIFIALKNPYSSAGFEPANLGSNGKYDNN
jgi:hypothetical protein